MDLLLNQLKHANQESPLSVAYYLLRFIINYKKINNLEFYDFDKIKSTFFTKKSPFFNKDMPLRDLEVACMMYFLDKLYYDTYIKNKTFGFTVYDKANYSLDNLILENKLLALVISEQYE